MKKLAYASVLPVLCSLFGGSVYAAIDCEKNEQLAHPLKYCSSPIIIDTDGKGFHLTSEQNGVLFDIAGNGNLVQMGWTAAGSTNAFLALPHNGEIVNGKDLFGNFTPQPRSDHPNGFLALAEYDKPEKGGNNDGVIDETDAIFSSLRLWIDKNHNGLAEPEEIFNLPDLGVFSISLRYRTSRRECIYGNLFRYKARINLTDPEESESHAGPVAYDVFFESNGGN